MFGVQFYPTPDHLIDRMVEPFVGSRWRAFTKSRILEPSAGKGDICDRLVNQYGVACKSISCIEIDPELRMVLSGKGYRVLDSDFLEYGEDYWFDLIVMNPPFAAGVDHLLHAWEIMRDGDIVCILNAETIHNPHTEKRRLLSRIIDEHGRCEFVENAFADAERKTGVEIAIVWLTKQAGSIGVEFGEGLEHDAAVPDEEFQPNALASRNLLQSLNTDLVFLRHDEWFESTFFRIKFFKKGTVHLEFKDEHAWAEFNRRAAAGKNWIGGGY